MKMENMTEERIDEVIDSAFLEINEYFLDDYKMNDDGFKKIINELSNNEYPAYSSKLASNLAAFKTARDHCIEIFRSVLKELLCD
ncbi:MAG: hypothetical protein HFI06_12515 [Eubacterium sp.]|jgi:hypothetical protein|nr:hypothetical protein [Eubacterium sp.]